MVPKPLFLLIGFLVFLLPISALADNSTPSWIVPPVISVLIIVLVIVLVMLITFGILSDRTPSLHDDSGTHLFHKILLSIGLIKEKSKQKKTNPKKLNDISNRTYPKEFNKEVIEELKPKIKLKTSHKVLFSLGLMKVKKSE